MDNQKIILGIDLGTTYCAMAYVDEHGEAKIIPNSENERITPSVVFFETENNIIVGQNAKDEMELSPGLVVSFVKREMGKKKEEVRGDDDWAIPMPYEYHDKMWSPEEISALILKKLKEDAEKHFQGREVTDAIITVPAYFNDSEKQATKDAGKMAGFNVLQVINEPTAAAIAYGLSKSADQDQKVFVFDLGGGTFDVTLLDVKSNGAEKEINIINTDGDHRLGGKDWDDKIIDYVAEEFIGQYNEDPREDADAMADLRVRAEKVKKSLSDKESARIICKTEDNSLKLEITREKFQELTEDLMGRIEGLCTSVFSNCDPPMSWDSVDTILLAGGSTRMPMVIELLSRLSGKEVRADLVNPDECVALGAAMQATIVSMEKDDVVVSQEVQDKLGRVTVNDITSHTLGEVVIVVRDGEHVKKVTPMIKKGTKVPYSHSDVFTTMVENQSGIPILIKEGESENPENCVTIQEGTLPITKPLPKDAPIEFTYSMSADGMLTVTAKDKTNGEEMTVRVERSSNLNASEVSEGKAHIGNLEVT